MQYRPDAKDLILAVQDFLMKEILPLVEDKEDISYKTLVSWNMLGVLVREIENGYSPTEVQEFRKSQTKLSQKIRSEGISSPNSQAGIEIKERLRENLKIANPRYSLENLTK